jgi:hypothetical protein
VFNGTPRIRREKEDMLWYCSNQTISHIIIIKFSIKVNMMQYI